MSVATSLGVGADRRHGKAVASCLCVGGSGVSVVVAFWQQQMGDSSRYVASTLSEHRQQAKYYGMSSGRHIYPSISPSPRGAGNLRGATMPVAGASVTYCLLNRYLRLHFEVLGVYGRLPYFSSTALYQQSLFPCELLLRQTPCCAVSTVHCCCEVSLAILWKARSLVFSSLAYCLDVAARAAQLQRAAAHSKVRCGAGLLHGKTGIDIVCVVGFVA